MGVRVGPFVKCLCGKIHILAPTPSAFCSQCDRSLWEVAMGQAK